MHPSKKFASTLILICSSAVSLSACSATPLVKSSAVSNARAGAPFTQSYVWYDGPLAQTVWVNPHALAEFNATPQSAKALSKADAQAKMSGAEHAPNGLRIWQVQQPTGIVTKALTVSNPTGQYSPVFHDGSSSSAQMRALPGNMIVYLNPTWDAAAVNQWIAAHQLEVVKKLNGGNNIFVFKTAPGLDALNKANALYQSGEVVAAFPDWWTEVTTR
ncbi:MAG: hypothetical protein HOP24_04645 [Sideroxydans sp.]|nr:hypothetical protein [Sideroxydans sp.]